MNDIKVGKVFLCTTEEEYEGHVYFMSGCCDIDDTGKMVASEFLDGRGNSLIELRNIHGERIKLRDYAGCSGMIKNGLVYNIHK